MVLGNGLNSKIAFFVTLFSLVACQADAIGNSTGRSKQVADDDKGGEDFGSRQGPKQHLYQPSPKYRVGQHEIGLTVDSDSCWFTDTIDNQHARKLKLSLGPPCYLLTWQQSPPIRRDGGGNISDGLPIGNIGDPIAWLYEKGKGVTTVAVIGDPIPPDLRSSRAYLSAHSRGYRCASSMQGVLLSEKKVELSKKRENVAIFCVESGADEKDFWLLSYD
jgi:hypothetical protein